MFRLIYRSVTHEEMSPEAISELVNHARRRNGLDRITGLLLYHDRQVFQVLEGDEAAVRACYARVKSDPRHGQIVTISEKPATTRAFSKWFLGYKDPSRLPLMARAGALTFDQIADRLDAVAEIDDVREGKQALVSQLDAFLKRAARV